MVNVLFDLQEEVTVTEDGDAVSCYESQHIDFDWKDPGLWPPSIRNKERLPLVDHFVNLEVE